MFQTTAHRFALVLAMTLLAAPVGRMYAQSTSPAPQPDVVTGGDPEPPGEPPPPPPKGNVMHQTQNFAAVVPLELA